MNLAFFGKLGYLVTIFRNVDAMSLTPVMLREIINRFSFLPSKIIEKHNDENNLSQP